MTLLRHIRRCNHWRPERFVPLWRGEAQVGLIRRDNAEALHRFTEVFSVESDGVWLIAPGGFDAVSAAVDAVVERLVAEGRVAKWRNEFFAVAPRWGEPPVFKLDRGAVSFFGVRAYGVHVNGWRRAKDGIELWIGRRAADKKVAPDKLDNLIAGGIGHEHGVEATLIKEADEEASLPPEIAGRAVAVGAVSYRMEVEYGLRSDVLFLYDLEVPRDFTPVNRDGEIVEFRLMPAQEALERVRDTEDFKFNVNLVIIDFALRHGLVTAADPDYLELVTGLRPPFG